jgi:toxin ParE1/3/4
LSVKGAKRFLVRPRAGAQITAAIQYYAVTMQAPSAARGFVDELQSAYELIKRNPDAGSPRLEAELGMPGLRSWRLPKYPYLIVYFRHPDFVDVVDVPHTRTNYLAALINDLGLP